VRCPRSSTIGNNSEAIVRELAWNVRGAQLAPATRLMLFFRHISNAGSRSSTESGKGENCCRSFDKIASQNTWLATSRNGVFGRARAAYWMGLGHGEASPIFCFSWRCAVMNSKILGRYNRVKLSIGMANMSTAIENTKKMMSTQR
jgi:hypothetical protein